MGIWTLTLTTRVFDAQGLQFAASAENLMDTEPKGGERPADMLTSNCFRDRDSAMKSKMVHDLKLSHLWVLTTLP